MAMNICLEDLDIRIKEGTTLWEGTQLVIVNHGDDRCIDCAEGLGEHLKSDAVLLLQVHASMQAFAEASASTNCTSECTNFLVQVVSLLDNVEPGKYPTLDYWTA